MLVCPQCQFENPNTNKFCQECGASLSQNTCLECDSLVPFDSLTCQECGAIAGVVWWAVISGTPKQSTANSAHQAGSTGTNNNPDRNGSYLDSQRRYKLLEPLSSTTDGTHEFYTRVLDCQPFQLSLLEALARQDQQASVSDVSMPAGTEEVTSDSRTATSIKAVTLPLIAHPYLALEDGFYQALPLIHDAWHQDGQQILLLEDRTQFPLLSDFWVDSQEQNLPPLQMLHWLYEMADLWQTLEAIDACESLLHPANIRIDEDQAICLQRLYTNANSTNLTLVDLGQFWKSLFAASQQTLLEAISLLLADLETGKLATVDELRSRIEAIAQDLQSSPSDIAEIISDPDLEADESILTADAALDGEIDRIDDVSTTAASRHLEVTPEELATVVEDDGEAEGDDLPTVVLPMQLFNLEDVGRTDIGRQRDHNEDYFGIETQVSRLESPSGKTMHVRNLYVLCDGMGGHAGGEVASALAVDTLRRYFKDKWQSTPFVPGAVNRLPGPDVLLEAVQIANKAIFDVNQQNARSGSGRMGTTLVLLLIQDTEVAIAHVGDSRLYRYTRKRGLEQITVDHEVGQREIQRGVDPDIAYARPDAYQLTQALGPRDEHFIKPDVQYLELNEDALLLLCSDGLSDNDLLEKHDKTHLEPLLSSQTNLDQGVSQLIDLANQINGHDNITAIAIRAKVRPNLDHLR